MRPRHSVGTFSAPERFLLYMSRASLNAPHFHRDNRREAVGLIERDSAMGRVSQAVAHKRNPRERLRGRR